MRLVKNCVAIGAPVLVLACSAGAGDFGGDDVAQDEPAETATTQ